jgi:hypothetical protein
VGRGRLSPVSRNKKKTLDFSTTPDFAPFLCVANLKMGRASVQLWGNAEEEARIRASFSGFLDAALVDDAGEKGAAVPRVYYTQLKAAFVEYDKANEGLLGNAQLAALEKVFSLTPRHTSPGRWRIRRQPERGR